MQSGVLDKLYIRYRDSVAFYAVYIREAHPIDGWRMRSNEKFGIRIANHKTLAERVEAAADCCGALHLQMPLLVDGINDKVGEAYSGFPDRLYLIDRMGTIAYKGGRGPHGMQPAELEQSIVMLLADEAKRFPRKPAESSDKPKPADTTSSKEQKNAMKKKKEPNPENKTKSKGLQQKETTSQSKPDSKSTAEAKPKVEVETKPGDMPKTDAKPSNKPDAAGGSSKETKLNGDGAGT